MLKRLVPIAVIILTFAAFAASPAYGAWGSASSSGATPSQVRHWNAWAYGSDTNPFIHPDLCGEQVGRFFYLNPSSEPSLVVDCTVPVGVPLILPVGGFTVWAEPGETDRDIHRRLLSVVTDQCCAAVQVDGTKLDTGQGFRTTRAFSIPLGRQSLIRMIDPLIPRSQQSVRAVWGGWTLRIDGLAAGAHTIIASADYLGTTYGIQFNLTVA